MEDQSQCCFMLYLVRGMHAENLLFGVFIKLGTQDLFII